MKNVSFSLRAAAGCLLLAAVIFLTGCKTTEPENMSSRPWGYRSGYDYGLPGMLNEGR